MFRRNDELHVYDLQMLTNVEVEGMLRHIKSTASGCDNIPAWLLRSCSYELADIVTYILNLSFSTGKVPTLLQQLQPFNGLFSRTTWVSRYQKGKTNLFWLNALVTPVPKVSKPTGFSDFRPIAVTPHLSRLAEKLIVRRWLRPALSFEQLKDQYAFKDTGSTTAALVHFMHRVTEMLETNDFVNVS